LRPVNLVPTARSRSLPPREKASRPAGNHSADSSEPLADRGEPSAGSGETLADAGETVAGSGKAVSERDCTLADLGERSARTGGTFAGVPGGKQAEAGTTPPQALALAVKSGKALRRALGIRDQAEVRLTRSRP